MIDPDVERFLDGVEHTFDRLSLGLAGPGEVEELAVSFAARIAADEALVHAVKELSLARLRARARLDQLEAELLGRDGASDG